MNLEFFNRFGMKFNKNSSVCSRIVPSERTDIIYEANSSFTKFFVRALRTCEMQSVKCKTEISFGTLTFQQCAVYMFHLWLILTVPWEQLLFKPKRVSRSKAADCHRKRWAWRPILSLTVHIHHFPNFKCNVRFLSPWLIQSSKEVQFPALYNIFI